MPRIFPGHFSCNSLYKSVEYYHQRFFVNSKVGTIFVLLVGIHGSMMKLLIAPAALIFAFHLSYAQETIRISGAVKDAETREPLPFVHIIDINKGSGATSGPDGTFSLRVPKKDTLYFSSVGYKATYLTFRDSAKSRYDELTILMQPETITLRPVEINAYNLEEILNKAKTREFSLEKDKPVPLFEETKEKEKPAIGIGVAPGGGAALEGALTAFANLFNNEFKQRKKLKELYEQDKIQSLVEQRERQLIENYKDIARKATGLEKEEFRLFSELYMPDLDFLLAADDYQLTLKILQDFREFKYRYKLQEVSLEELMENAKFKK